VWWLWGKGNLEGEIVVLGAENGDGEAWDDGAGMTEKMKAPD